MNRVVILYKNYVPGIDGLRAIAVLAVILYHASPGILPGGFSGVDVFFVISGYVISSSLAQSSYLSLSDILLKFYSKRILRILPALICCLLAVSVIATLFIPLSWLSGTIGLTGVAAFLGVSNVTLALFGDGYFSPREEFNPFVHTWSLGLEEQFYVIFPLIFYFWQKNEKNRAAHIINELLLPLLLITSIIIAAVTSAKNPNHAYYLLPSRLWELGSGALLFRFHRKKQLVPRNDEQATLYLLSGFSLVIAGFAFSSKNLFPFPFALLPVVGTSLMICGTLINQQQKDLFRCFIESRPLVYIGKISYSLYLWHWPVFSVGKWTGGLDSIVGKFMAVIVAGLLAAASYRYVEVPCRNADLFREMPKTRVITLGMALLGISILMATGMILYRSQLSLSVTANNTIWYPSIPGEIDGGLRAIPGKISRLFDNNRELAQVISSPRAPYQNQNPRKKLFVVGDSHALAYSTMFGMVSEKLGVDVYLYGKGGQSLANLQMPVKGGGADYSGYFRSSFQEIEAIANPGDFIFFASLRTDRLSDQWGPIDQARTGVEVNTIAQRQNSQSALQEAAELIERFEGKSLNVILDAPKPVFKAPLFRCSDWFNSSNPVCAEGFAVDSAFLLKQRQPVMESLRILQTRYPRLLVWDPFPVLCPNEICVAYDQEGPLFFDGDHLTAHGNRKLYPGFARLIQ